MKIYFAKSTNGFYDTAIHGALKIAIADPTWVRPTTRVVLLPDESYPVSDQIVHNTSDEPMTLTDVPDLGAIPQTVEVDNPDSKIPRDAVEITESEYAALLSGQANGQCIVADNNGRPVLVAPPLPTHEQVIAQYEQALDAHLDAVAKQHRYNDRFTFALRAGYSGPFQAEGTAFAEWMDACNVKAYQLLQDVADGSQPLPTIGTFIASLPSFA